MSERPIGARDEELLANSLRAWLEDEITTLPDGPALPAAVRAHVLTRFPTTPQRRRWWRLAWPGHRDDASRSVGLDGTPSARRRSLTMSGTLKLIGAGAIVALAAGYALWGALLTQPPPGPAAPASLVVAADGSGDFRTITEAVAAAAEGDTILVRPGTYSESIVIDRTITLTGDGERESVVITTPPTGGFAITLRETTAQLSGLTIKGDAGRTPGVTIEGILIEGGAPVIDDLLFEQIGRPFGSGVAEGTEEAPLLLDGASTATIRRSEFRQTADIHVDGGSSPLFEDNSTIGVQLNLWVTGDDTVVRRNTIQGSLGYGIVVNAPTRALIEGNTIIDAAADAIKLGLSSGAGVAPIVRGNAIRGPGGIGISVAAGAAPVIEDNSIHGGTTGILLAEGAPTLIGNSIEGAEVGLALAAGTTATMEGNTICGNADNVRLVVGGQPQPDPELPGNEVCADGLVSASDG